ncbi:MAG: hypothetical protein IJ873_04575, partial [Lachnospiraceae bacterium]|nr:hypothetical protein [Lachnospiraceae bacterium]
MMKRKGFRSFVAVLALVSMLLENTATVFAVEAANGNTEQVQETVAETVSESSEESTEAQAEPEEAPAEEQTQEPASEQAEEPEEAPSEEASQPEENPVGEEGSIEPEVTVSVDEPSYNNEEVASEETAAEEAPEIDVPDTINISGDRIEAVGYEDLYIAVNTDQMNDRDTFRIRIDGLSGEAVCDAKLYGTLSKSDASIYKLERLGQSSLTISATDLSEGMTVEYLTRDDGYPQINLISEPEPEVEKILKVADDGKSLEGSGYENISVSFNTAELKKDVTFSLVPGTSAEVRYNGEPIEGAIKGLSRNAGTIQLSNLNNQSFVLYIVGDDTNTIAADYTISSVENGAVIIKVYDSGKEQTVKRVYEFEDDDVKVTATIEKAEAVPDDAYFSVTKIEPESEEYDYNSYMEALNDNTAENITYHEGNTLLYDIAFYTDEDKTTEIEPEEGSVNVAIQFKKDQLNNEIGVNEENNVVITHIREENEALETESLETQVSLETGELEFVTDSFSVIAVTNGSETVGYTFTGQTSGWTKNQIVNFNVEATVSVTDLANRNIVIRNNNGELKAYYKRSDGQFNEVATQVRFCRDNNKDTIKPYLESVFKVTNSEDAYLGVISFGLTYNAEQGNTWADLRDCSITLKVSCGDFLTSKVGITQTKDIAVAAIVPSDTADPSQELKSVQSFIDQSTQSTTVRSLDSGANSVQITSTGGTAMTFAFKENAASGIAAYVPKVNSKYYTHTEIMSGIGETAITDNNLGCAEDYGIVANEFTLGDHMDSNVATGKIILDHIAFDHDTYTNNTGQSILASVVEGDSDRWYSDKHHNSPITIFTTDAVKKKYVDDT